MWKRICHFFHPTWRQIQGSHFAFQHLHKVNVGILKHTDIPEAGLVAVSKTGQQITSRHTKTAKTHDESAKKLCNMYSYLQLFWFVMWKLWNWTKIWNILESPKVVVTTVDNDLWPRTQTTAGRHHLTLFKWNKGGWESQNGTQPTRSPSRNGKTSRKHIAENMTPKHPKAQVGSKMIDVKWFSMVFDIHFRWESTCIDFLSPWPSPKLLAWWTVKMSNFFLKRSLPAAWSLQRISKQNTFAATPPLFFFLLQIPLWKISTRCIQN